MSNRETGETVPSTLITSDEWIARVREVLRRDNVVEPSGEWSAYDVARVLDPLAREPRHLFDTGAGTQPRAQYVALTESIIRNDLRPSGRYVGGTSGYLYSLPRV